MIEKYLLYFFYLHEYIIEKHFQGLKEEHSSVCVCGEGGRSGLFTFLPWFSLIFFQHDSKLGPIKNYGIS